MAAFDHFTVNNRVLSLESSLNILFDTFGSSHAVNYIKMVSSPEPIKSYMWLLPAIPESIAIWLVLRSKDLIVPVNLKRVETNHHFHFSDPSDPEPLNRVAAEGWIELHDGQLPAPWPSRFGDRLSVIQFDYFKNATSGVAGSAGMSNAASTVCDIMQPSDICVNGGADFCDGIVRHTGNSRTCAHFCNNVGLSCTGAYDDMPTGGCPDSVKQFLTCESIRSSLVCRCAHRI